MTEHLALRTAARDFLSWSGVGGVNSGLSCLAPRLQSGVAVSNTYDNSPFSRRDVLSFIGSVVAVGFVGCGSSPTPTSPSASSSSSAASTSTPSTTSGTSVSTGSTNGLCTVTPSLTEGPYFVDERLNRSDIRSDPSTGIVRPGVALTMRMQLSQISSVAGCTPLVGALVDTWHCDALGVYSDIAAQSSRG